MPIATTLPIPFNDFRLYSAKALCKNIFKTKFSNTNLFLNEIQLLNLIDLILNKILFLYIFHLYYEQTQASIHILAVHNFFVYYDSILILLYHSNLFYFYNLIHNQNIYLILNLIHNFLLFHYLILQLKYQKIKKTKKKLKNNFIKLKV